MPNMSLLLLTIPLLNTLIIGTLGRYIGIIYTKWLSIISYTITTIIVYSIYINILHHNNDYYIYLGDWLHIDYMYIPYSMNIDTLTISMLLPITTISLLVNLYAFSYMSNDPHQIRFYTYLSLFTSFMIILVVSDNYMILFLGWEYIGLASFLLIGYWYNNIGNVKASLLALLVNKIGDILFIIAIILFINIYNSTNFALIYSLVPYINTDLNSLICLCLLIACVSKSAQWGLHSWLIWAMAGPTPVSVLLHAATLVIAGVYVLIRSSYILEYTPTILLVILWLGAISTISSGIIAIFSNDIKRIIALSTMSQLGMMFIAIGISSYNMAIFHIICHSIYKALLFMSAGSIIHSILYENQDIRFMGINNRYLPITYISIFIASLSLMAFPYLTGYYSKDIIIESMIGTYTISGYIGYIITILSALCTTIYSMKIIYYVFYNRPNMGKYYYHYIAEGNIYLILPMIILTILAIYTGYFIKDIYLGIGSSVNGIYIHPNNIHIIETEFGIHNIYKLIPLFTISIATIMSIYIYEYLVTIHKIYENQVLSNIYTLFNGRLMYDQIFNNIILRPILNLAYLLNTYIEHGIIQYIGPYGISRLLNNISYNVSRLTTNLLHNYSIYILVSIIYLSISLLYVIYYVHVLPLYTLSFILSITPIIILYMIT